MKKPTREKVGAPIMGGAHHGVGALIMLIVERLLLKPFAYVTISAL